MEYQYFEISLKSLDVPLVTYLLIFVTHLLLQLPINLLILSYLFKTCKYCKKNAYFFVLHYFLFFKGVIIFRPLYFIY